MAQPEQIAQGNERFRILTEWEISDDRTARESHSKLCAAGFSPDRLGLLVGAAVLRSPDAMKLSPWESVLGMTKKQIAYLPKQLTQMARTIKKLNQHPLLKMDMWKDASLLSLYTKAEKRTIIKNVDCLPSLLQFYAGFIDCARKGVGHSFSQRGTSPRAHILLCLMQEVREATGKPMYADLAKVLTAAAHIAGLSKRDLRGLNADSLKTLEARQKKNK